MEYRILEQLEESIEHSDQFLTATWNAHSKGNYTGHLLNSQNQNQDFKISFADYKTLMDDMMRLRLRSNRAVSGGSPRDTTLAQNSSFMMGDNIGQMIVDLKDQLYKVTEQKKFLQNSMQNIMKRQSDMDRQ